LHRAAENVIRAAELARNGPGDALRCWAAFAK
jgi:hypothetical protein